MPSAPRVSWDALSLNECAWAVVAAANTLAPSIRGRMSFRTVCFSGGCEKGDVPFTATSGCGRRRVGNRNCCPDCWVRRCHRHDKGSSLRKNRPRGRLQESPRDVLAFGGGLIAFHAQCDKQH